MYPILVEFGPVIIHSLWLFIAIGFIVWSFTVARLARRHRLKLDFILQHSIFFAFWTLIISRIFFIVFHYTYFQNFLSFLQIWDKGLSFWGAVTGFVFSFVFLAKKEKESVGRWFDVFALAFPVGMIFGSMGTFLDGIAHGRETLMPWGIIFESDAVKYAVPIHPTQLYSMLYFALFAIFLWKHEKTLRQVSEGFLFEMTVLVFSLLRFIEEFFRGDDTMLILDLLRLPQVVALGISVFLIWRHQKYLWRTLHSITAGKKSSTATG